MSDAKARRPQQARTVRLTLVLEPDEYDRLRFIAFIENSKIQPLLREGLTLMMAKRKALGPPPDFAAKTIKAGRPRAA